MKAWSKTEPSVRVEALQMVGLFLYAGKTYSGGQWLVFFERQVRPSILDDTEFRAQFDLVPDAEPTAV